MTDIDVGLSTASVLAPEVGLLPDLDTPGLASATARAFLSAIKSPGPLSAAVVSFTGAVARVPLAAAAVAGGLTSPSPVPVDPRDKRFANAAWRENALFFALRQVYAATRMLSDEIVELCPDEIDRAKASLVTGFIYDALSPTNFPLTNPDVLRRAFETGGSSAIAGLRNLARDVLTNRGRPRQVDRDAFVVGTDLACTPGKVVFRNELMELIQYMPQTSEVHAVPLLASPPWINKYYVMDLAPGRSFLEWAVQQQRTVFAISYRNPDSSMGAVSLDDYLIKGPKEALDVIEEITGSPKIDLVGLCLGGALTAVTAAHLAKAGDDRIGTLTLLNTMLDYSEPGPLGIFTDEAAVARLERRMAHSGVLEGTEMSATFDILRANDLLFSYVVSSWLMGQPPPAFDILAWNADSTRMPARMHSFYLRSFYVRNELARGALEIDGETVSLADIKNSTYIVAAINDHIVPWQASYKSIDLLAGETRFVLSSGGHIAGIVNPPNPKSWYEVSEDSPGTATEWRTNATRVQDSWWKDWTEWSSARAGELVPPPPLGSKRHPATLAAPGEFVHG